MKRRETARAYGEKKELLRVYVELFWVFQFDFEQHKNIRQIIRINSFTIDLALM